MNELDNISGFDLVRQVLAHPQGSVEKLLNLAGNGECEWLELKAGMWIPPQDREQQENDADAYWHVAKAVIAMLNTRGGLVLIGINDQGQAVPLHECDPRKIIQREGLEAYRRKEILERIDPQNGEWRTGREGIWKLEANRLPPDHIEVLSAKYQGHEVALILIKPAKGECIRVWNNNVEQVLRRVSGHVGKIETVFGSKRMATLDHSREVESKLLGDLLKKFFNEVGALTIQPDQQCLTPKTLEGHSNERHHQFACILSNLHAVRTCQSWLTLKIDGDPNGFQQLETGLKFNINDKRIMESVISKYEVTAAENLKQELKTAPSEYVASLFTKKVKTHEIEGMITQGLSAGMITKCLSVMKIHQALSDDNPRSFQESETCELFFRILAARVHRAHFYGDALRDDGFALLKQCSEKNERYSKAWEILLLLKYLTNKIYSDKALFPLITVNKQGFPDQGCYGVNDKWFSRAIRYWGSEEVVEKWQHLFSMLQNILPKPLFQAITELLDLSPASELKRWQNKDIKICVSRPPSRYRYVYSLKEDEEFLKNGFVWGLGGRKGFFVRYLPPSLLSDIDDVIESPEVFCDPELKAIGAGLERAWKGSRSDKLIKQVFAAFRN